MKEGFWHSKREPNLPKPIGNIEPWAGKGEFLGKLSQVESIARSIAYRGWSTCRICECHNGSQTFSHNGWEWPSGFRHYVEVHNVKPSQGFMDFVSKSVAKEK